MPRGPLDVAKDIHEALGIPSREAELYVRAVVEGGLSPADGEERSLAGSLAARGMLIAEAGGRSYLPIHPRMALSNLFRAYEEELVRRRREMRLLVDKLTLELIPLLPGESKGTNPSALRGASKGRVD